MANSESPEVFDFIIVGSGPAGSVVASRLARTAKAPKVLLLEAGGSKIDQNALILADRYSIFMTYPDYNWGYKTVPQAHLNGRQLDYSRGRGLGGTSRINFAAYTVGPKGDYDHWAELVGDDFFNWTNTRRRYDSIETYDTNVNPAYNGYVDIKAQHGTRGPLKVSFPNIFERGVTTFNDAAVECGITRNYDINSGDPIGIGMIASTGSKGFRSTALCFLEGPPVNMTILADSPASQIVFEGKRAVGVKVQDEIYRASKEVILSAGALDTPKLLLLSGIGPKAELASHEIQCIEDLPGVGKDLRDHWFFGVNVELKSGGDDRPPFADPEYMAAARAQFEKDGTGALTVFYNLLQMGWLRPSEALEQSKEYKDLPLEEQQHFKYPTVPAWEICTHCPPMHPDAQPDKSYLTVLAIGMTPQSRGTVTLASSDPKDAPLCDPNIFSDPFDSRNAIEATRIIHKIINSPTIVKQTESVFSAPKSMSDEDIMDYARERTTTAWHMSCTAKMGKESDPEAVLDTRFRVRGLEGLRVVDMSAAPIIPNCHTMAVAYQIGEMGAERLIEEYALA